VSTTATCVPCTWPRNTTPRTPSLSASLRRLAATATGSSPTPAERLNRANGPVERPPARVVTTRRTRIGCQRFMNDGTSTSSSGSLAVAEADGSSDDENEEYDDPVGAGGADGGAGGSVAAAGSAGAGSAASVFGRPKPD